MSQKITFNFDNTRFMASEADVEAISRREAKRNQRLIDMLADYRDMPHEI